MDGLHLPAPRVGALDGHRLRGIPALAAPAGLTPPLDADGRPRPEGFTIDVAPLAVRIAAADAAGERHARRLLAESAAAGMLRAGTVADWPRFRQRGVVEGFYGQPWSHAERLQMLAELGTLRMNRYLYAPKDDPFHRARWREPYPAAEAAALAELAAAARAAGVELVYAIHPGLDIVHSDGADQAALAAKAQQVHRLGIRRFALLFDDIPDELDDPRDLRRWGRGPHAAGLAHGATCARFDTDVLAPLGLGGTLLMVPADYAGSCSTPYREGLSGALGASTAVVWTGDDIVVGAVTADEGIRARSAFGERELLLWDNFPVNDFDRSRAFLGPLLGRDPALQLAGIVANPMVEYEPSRFAIHAVAAWAWNPDAYDPAAAAEAALHAVAGPDAELLRPLVAAASSWPPSAPQYPELAAQVDASLPTGHPTPALAALLDGFDSLGGLEPTTPLRAALLPWARSGPLTATVIRAALARARGEAADPAGAWEAARTAGHGLARDVARAAAERVLGRALPDRVRPEGDPAAQAATGD